VPGQFDDEWSGVLLNFDVGVESNISLSVTAEG